MKPTTVPAELPEALRLADALRKLDGAKKYHPSGPCGQMLGCEQYRLVASGLTFETLQSAAEELRRQHAELETLRAKLKTYEDLGDAGSDVQLLRMGYAAARLEIESLKAQLTERASHGQAPAQAMPAAVAGLSEAVAYLDIGTGGYLDLGTDLADEALSRLPKGRHALVIAGTYGIDGYTAAPTTQPSPVAQGDALDAARLDWLTFNLSGKALRDIGVVWSEHGDARRAIDAALAAQEGK